MRVAARSFLGWAARGGPSSRVSRRVNLPARKACLSKEKGARPFRTGHPPYSLTPAYLPSGQSGQPGQEQSAIAFATAGAAANAAVLADSSTMAAISFFMSFSFDGLIENRCATRRAEAADRAQDQTPKANGGGPLRAQTEPACWKRFASAARARRCRPRRAGPAGRVAGIWRAPARDYSRRHAWRRPARRCPAGRPSPSHSTRASTQGQARRESTTACDEGAACADCTRRKSGRLHFAPGEDRRSMTNVNIPPSIE